MQNQIQQELIDLEQRKQIKILYAVESGVGFCFKK